MTSEFVSPNSVSMPLEQILHEEEMDIDKVPPSFAQYKELVHSQLEKKYQALIKMHKSIELEPEFQALLNTVPSSADKVKRFETTYEKAGKMLESFAIAVELLGTALLPEAALKMKYRSMITSKENQGLRQRLQSDEAKIERNVQILYNQAKDIAIQYNIPTELIDQYFANEDYIAMDKLIVKAKKCKHGLRYNPATGQIKCIRKREVVGKVRQGEMEMEASKGQKQKPSCYQRRKNDCITTTHCAWEVGKRCKSKAKIEGDKKNTMVTYQNPLYHKVSPPPPNFRVANNPLYSKKTSSSYS
jgi:hypothetical protein